MLFESLEVSEQHTRSYHMVRHRTRARTRTSIRAENRARNGVSNSILTSPPLSGKCQSVQEGSDNHGMCCIVGGTSLNQG